MQVSSHADDLNAIVEAYREQDRAIESLSVEYRCTTTALGSPADIVRFMNTPFLPVTEETFTYKHGMRHYTLHHANDGMYDHLVDREDDGSPLKVMVASGFEKATNGELVFSLDGDTNQGRQRLGSIQFADKQQINDESLFGQKYFRSLLRTLPDVFGGDQERFRDSLVALADQAKLTLKPDGEAIDGVECVVIEWNDNHENLGSSGRSFQFKHRIWCDPALGYAVRRHDVLLDDGHTLLSRVVLNGFTEVAPGTWYPKHVMFHNCPHPARSGIPPEASATPLVRVDLVVDSLSVNDVPDDVFTLEMPPETIVADGRYVKDGQAINYVQPATEAEAIAVIAEIIEREMGKTAVPVSRDPLDGAAGESRRGTSLGKFILINLVLVVAVVAILAWRR